MKRSNQQLHIQSISLDKLKKSDENVRKVPHTPADIKALANSIDAHGQFQNLVVKTERDEEGEATGFYLVTAGEGRRLAQLLRVKRKQIKADHSIPCIIDDTHTASAVSLAENDLRRNMHPADQFTAFKGLADAGQSIEDIAAQFSVTPLVVKQRLKLANVAAEFIERYRKGSVELSHLMALALTDDHAKQHTVWKSLRKHEQHAAVIRERLTQQEIAVDEPIVRFVGLEAYEKAGGQVRRDLFAEQENDGYVMDADLLRQLADEKLEHDAVKIKAEGHAWVQVIPTLDYAKQAEYGRDVYKRQPQSRPPFLFQGRPGSLARHAEATARELSAYEARPNLVGGAAWRRSVRLLAQCQLRSPRLDHQSTRGERRARLRAAGAAGQTKSRWSGARAGGNQESAVSADQMCIRDRCTNDPGTLSKTPDCINAQEAERLEGYGSLRNSGPIGLDSKRKP